MPLNEDQYEPVRNSIHDVVRLGGQNAQFILLGDTDHSDNGIARFVADQKTLVALAETGVSKLFLEMPQSFQTYADRLASGEIDKANFVANMEVRFEAYHQSPAEAQERLNIIADTILNAKRVGIETHFADGGEGITQHTDFQKKVLEAVVDYQRRNNLLELKEHLHSDENKNRLQAHIIDHMKKNHPGMDPGGNPMGRFLDEFVITRIKGDESLAGRIRDTANGEKSAIFYGALHGLQSDADLDNHLGNTLKITINGKDDNWKKDDYGDKPDVIFNTAQGTVQALKGHPIMADLERSSLPVAPASSVQRPVFTGPTQ